MVRKWTLNQILETVRQNACKLLKYISALRHRNKSAQTEISTTAETISAKGEPCMAAFSGQSSMSFIDWASTSASPRATNRVGKLTVIVEP